MILPLAFIALGYPLAYWGANQLKHWNRSIQTTEAAPMALLFAVQSAQALRATDKIPIHPVPFPYTPPTTGGAQPSSNPSGGTPGGSSGNNGGLSPNYPGGPGSTIPTPSIPGSQSI
jgi:hypothetical protein